MIFLKNYKKAQTTIHTNNTSPQIHLRHAVTQVWNDQHRIYRAHVSEQTATVLVSLGIRKILMDKMQIILSFGDFKPYITLMEKAWIIGIWRGI